MAGADVLFSLLLELEEQEVNLLVCDDELLAAPRGRLSMRLRHELRRYRPDLLRESRLPAVSPYMALMLLNSGQVEVL